MSFQYRAWLPEGALAGGRGDRLLAETVEQWSAKWFAGRSVGLLAELRPGAAAAADEPDEQWHVLEDGLALAASRAGRIAVAGLMLDAAADATSLSPADGELVERLAAGCLEDLRHRLTQLFRLPPETRWRAGDGPGQRMPTAPRGCAIGPAGGEPLIRLFVDTGLLIALVKAAVKVPPWPVPLQPIAAALAPQRVAISALLGRCELSLADLAALAEGDVLVLDRPLAAPLDLAIDGRAKPARCVIEEAGERLVLKVSEPFSG